MNISVMGTRRTNKEILALEVKIVKMYSRGEVAEDISCKLGLSRGYIYSKMRDLCLLPLKRSDEEYKRMMSQISLWYEMEEVKVVEIIKYYKISSKTFYSCLTAEGKERYDAT